MNQATLAPTAQTAPIVNDNPEHARLPGAGTSLDKRDQ